MIHLLLFQESRLKVVSRFYILPLQPLRWVWFLNFTNDKIYFFTSKSYKYISGCEDNLYADEIAYADIVNVDYCKKYVEIITEKGRQCLRCCSKEYRHSEYSKYMYNFIMDILDCLRKTDDVL